MKRSRLLTISLLLILQQASWAGPRTYQQAQAIAERQAAQMGVTISQQAKARSFNITPTSSVSSDEALTQSGTPAYYVFPYGENQGFSIVSGDDQMPELVAYSDKGTLDEANMPEQFRDFLKAYKQVAEAVAKGDKQALRLMAQKRGLQASADYQQPIVEPLLGDIAWGHLDPYDNMCPSGYRAGYEAVAMAQLMRYWKYPKELKADIPAYTSEFKDGDKIIKYEIAQINKGETYDWDQMIPHYSSKWAANINYTDEQAAAVAKLVAHCGAAMQTIYSPYFGCESVYSAQPLVKYFGYDPDLACLIYRSYFSYDEWCKLLDNELMAKRPVIYSGDRSSEGRSFICDGADGKGLYHINWGDDGDGNGYFDISMLDPFEYSKSDGYNRNNFMIIGLQPDNGVKDEPLVQVQALSILPDNRKLTITKPERTSVSDEFTLTYTTILANMQPEAFDGLYNVGIEDEKGNYVPLGDGHSAVKLEGNSITGKEYYGGMVNAQFDYAFPIGTTKLYDIYSTDGGKTWQPCAYNERSYPFEVKATETSLSLVKENDDFKTTLWATGQLKQNRSCYFSYTMHNENDHDFFGEILVYISNTPDFSEDLTCRSDYVSIKAGGSTTHVLWEIPREAGDCYIWLYDVEHDKMLVDAQKFTILPAPKLKFLSKSLNVKKDAYERENAYLNDNRVELPVIDGEEAVVKYVFTNEGGDFEGELPLSVSAYSKDKEAYCLKLDKECSIKGNGTTSELEYRFKASDLQGYKSFCCNFADVDMLKLYSEMDFSLIPSYKLYLLDDSEKYYNISDDELVGYFGDTSTGISSAPTLIGGMKVSAGKGCLSIISDKAQSVAIYNLGGQCVRRLHLLANTAVNVTLPNGIYVIGKKKVAVR